MKSSCLAKQDTLVGEGEAAGKEVDMTKENIFTRSKDVSGVERGTSAGLRQATRQLLSGIMDGSRDGSKLHI